MAEYTQNYNLKKPAEEDFYNVKDFNDNADIIDQALKAHDDALATKETPQGAQEKADAALNSAKQYTDQEVGEVAQDLAAHKADKVNPHGVTKTQIGLSNVDNVKQMPIAGGTFTGPAYAQANTSYTTAQLRNIILSTADASGTAPNGAIWIKYKP